MGLFYWLLDDILFDTSILGKNHGRVVLNNRTTKFHFKFCVKFGLTSVIEIHSS